MIFEKLPDLSPVPADFTALAAIFLLLLPLLSFSVLYFTGRYLPRKGDVVATTLMGIATIIAVYLFINVFTGEAHYTRFNWFSLKTDSGETVFTISFLLNQVSATMLVIVTLIAFLVHIYSIEYMEGKRNYLRYFPYLALFTFAMLGIVLSDNLLITFIFWELVGFSSYLLIGFWFEKNSASKAAKKAFMYNRVGDFGFLIGLFILWSKFGTFELSVIQEYWQADPDTHTWLILAGLGIFCGTIGKSAQFPLMAWLPDAMEGPTPVSALLHAATMVAAGVFLLYKVFFLLSPPVLTVIAIVGSVTSFMGAWAAIAQNNIKKVLAFSTVSQLGYMVMAVGVGAYDAALFHLLTHAFFKACLFLAAGAVVHEMHHIHKHLFDLGYFNINFNTLDMRLMGGFRKKLPVTFIAYTLSALSLIGIPFFSGFLSKDAILIKAMEWAAVQDSSFAYLVPLSGFITVFLTAFYMGRQLFMIFFNEFRLGEIHETAGTIFSHIKEKSFLIRTPLVILSTLSLFPFFSLNPFDATSGWFLSKISSPVFPEVHMFHWYVPAFTIVLGLGGLAIAWKVYGKVSISDQGPRNSVWHRLSINNFYQDKLASAVVIRPISIIASALNYFDRKFVDGAVHAFAVAHVITGHILAWIDKNILDGIINLSARLSGVAGNFTRSFQKGNIQGYILYLIVFLLGLLLVIII